MDAHFLFFSTIFMTTTNPSSLHANIYLHQPFYIFSRLLCVFGHYFRPYSLTKRAIFLFFDNSPAIHQYTTRDIPPYRTFSIPKPRIITEIRPKMLRLAGHVENFCKMIFGQQIKYGTIWDQTKAKSSFSTPETYNVIPIRSFSHLDTHCLVSDGPI